MIEAKSKRLRLVFWQAMGIAGLDRPPQHCGMRTWQQHARRTRNYLTWRQTAEESADLHAEWLRHVQDDLTALGHRPISPIAAEYKRRPAYWGKRCKGLGMSDTHILIGEYLAEVVTL